MRKQVLLAPVPWEHLESAEAVPALSERVAFGSSGGVVPLTTIGIPVFIYGSQPQHRRFRAGVATWAGTLGAVRRALTEEEDRRRAGKHPEPGVRPPSAEAKDGPFIWFFEVLGIQLLASPRRLTEFKKVGGKGKPYTGDVPQWPVLAELDC
jgi:hypothetical protein